MKKCSRCQQVKPLDEFNKQARSLDGRQSRCKDCQTVEQRGYLRQKRPYKHEQFNNRKAWTYDDLMYLKENMDMDNETLGYKLGRSYSSIQRTKSNIKNNKINIEDYKPKTTKVCTYCKKEKPIEEFNFQDRKTRKRDSRCRDCHSLRGKIRYRKNYKKDAANHRKPWTVKEIKYVSENLNESVTEQAKKLKRTYKAVTAMRSRIREEMGREV